jgi:putative redox protein
VSRPDAGTLVRWDAGQPEAYTAEIGSHRVPLDPGAGVAGPTPVRLLLAGLAGCTAADVVDILRKGRQPIEGLVVRAEGERAPDHPRRYTRITLVYEVRGDGLDPAKVARAVALSEEKYCSVSATLREHVAVDTRIEIRDAGARTESS